MDSKDGCEELCNTTDEETLAYRRKRSRRVSFADITSVHVFDRDEDLETPPDSRPPSEPVQLPQSWSGEGDSAPNSGGLKDQPLHHHSDDGEGNGCGHDDVGEEEDEDEDGREPFVRNMDFSSPGSTVGSAASNDEDNFFGPVSESFIRSGRLSTESAASDNNHDVTMDSTAFSLHFRSLMQSDEQTNTLGGELKTPTRVNLAFEEKTPTGGSMPANAGSFMLLTGIKRLIPQSASNERSSVGDHSDDMSLIVQDLHKYDYGRLSPSLDALLIEGQKDCTNKSSTMQTKVPFNTSNTSSRVDDHNRVLKGDQFNSKHYVDKMIFPDDGAIGNHSLGESNKDIFDCTGKELHKDSPEAGKYLASSAGKCGTSPKKNISGDLFVNHDYVLGGYMRKEGMENNSCLSSSPVPMTKHSALTPSNDLNMSVASPKDKRDATDDGQKVVNEPQALSPESACSPHAKRQFLSYDGHISSSPSLERSKVSLKERKNLDDGQKADMNPETSFRDSAFSLQVKRQHLFQDADVSLSSKVMFGPFARGELHSFSNEEEINATKVATSIKNNTSEPKVCEVYRVENSEPIFHGLVGNSSLFRGSLGKNTEDPGPSATSVEVVEKQILDAAEKNVSQESVIRMDTADSKNLQKLDTGKGDCEAFLCDGECKKQVDTSTLNNSQDRKMTVSLQSSIEISDTSKDKELQRSSFHFPIEETMLTTLPNDPNFTIDQNLSTPLWRSPQSQIRAARKDIIQTDRLLELSSPAKRLEQTISPSGWQKGVLRTPIQQRITEKLFMNSPRKQMQETSAGNDADLSSTTAEVAVQSNSLVMEDKVCSTMAAAGVNSTEMILAEQKQRDSKSLNNSEFDLTSSFQTPLSSRVLLSSQFHSQDRNLLNRKSLAKSREMILPEVQLKSSVCESAPPEVSKKRSVGVVESSQWKEVYCLANGNGFQFHSQKDLLSNSLHTLQWSPSTHATSHSGYKRSQEVSFIDIEQINSTICSQKRLRQAAEVEDSNSHPEGHVASVVEADKIGGNAFLKHWKDVFSKFSTATEQLLPTSVDKLTAEEIGILEDMLDELWKAKMFEKLFSEIKSQKTTHHHLSKMQQERVFEAMWLQYRLIYERAKLQLLHAKRDRLLKNVQRLKSGVQECCNIQSTMLNREYSSGEVHNGDTHLQCLSSETDSKNQGAIHKLTTKKKDYEVVEQKVKRLIKYFHSSFKLKGDLGNAETMALVKDNLLKQNSCMLLRQYLQLWILDDIQRENDHDNVVLNYHGLMYQRFTMKNGRVWSTTSINLLNDANIRKSFPNMEATTAFEFIFTAENTNLIASSKNFLQVTEATSFLLGNLLDVVEESQAARLELRNLISTIFHSPCIEQLELQLCFINFSTGRKATLLLDMSGLKCGIYPSEILPTQLKIRISGEKTGALLSSQILNAIQSVKAGYHSTIIDLCRSVSKVVQAST